jgi:hypothetical protein
MALFNCSMGRESMVSIPECLTREPEQAWLAS